MVLISKIRLIIRSNIIQCVDNYSTAMEYISLYLNGQLSVGFEVIWTFYFTIPLDLDAVEVLQLIVQALKPHNTTVISQNNH